MRSASASLPLALLLTCCAQPEPAQPPLFVVDGIPVYGRAHDVSKSQIRRVIALDRTSIIGARREIFSAEVVSSVELHIYHTPRNRGMQEYQIYRRIGGTWRAEERMISGSALLVPTD